jgi:hypothetical protein
MLNKLILAISLSSFLVTASYAHDATEVAPCSNGFDDVNVCQLRS